jgi:hypothetical protein
MLHRLKPGFQHSPARGDGLCAIAPEGSRHRGSGWSREEPIIERRSERWRPK